MSRRLRALLVAALAAGSARADEAFVTAQGADAVSVVDLKTMKAVADVAVGGRPAGVAVAPDGARVYIASPEGGFISVIDGPARKVIRKIPVDGAPLGIAVAPDGRRLYATLTYQGRLVEIDPDNGPVRGISVGPMASGVAVTPDGRTLLVADRDDNAVSVIDLARFARVAVVPVGRHPFGLAIDPTGERAYAANVESDDVSVVDIAARRVIATLAAGSRPYTVALAGGRIFVANQHADSLSVFEAAGFARVGEVRVGEYPEGVGATRDGTAVVVACWFSNALWAIDAATLEVRAVATTADGPRAFGTFVRPAP